ncbi:hypothetical protein F0562_030945 [Nyssa sinensis]|uniref:Protein kinase domain-containing protein n=1 Tax=Nyssa sinensis TaxID=561372 RepID=A0A5J5AXD8_9ASTE|nr:hypothetical protein F0562_030945 [Nyssa sinensis]
MFSGRLLVPGYTALLVLALFPVNCLAKKNNHCDHPSCGNIRNISYPFRLKGDPTNCGDKKYELVCENNHTLVLSLYSGTYYVQAINDSNKTIRLVDPGIQKGNCSSLPLYSLNNHNFSCRDPYGPFYGESVVFVNCENPVKSRLYTDTTSCFDEITSSNRKRHSYVLVGDVRVSDVADFCSVDMMVVPSSSLSKNHGNLSFSDIHNELAYGFELSYHRTAYCVCRSFFRCISSIPALEFFAIGPRIIFGSPIVFAFLIYKLRRRHLSMFDAIESFLRSQNNIIPVRYSYSDIKKMTKGFKEKLGEGGYGSVYKGKLRSGHIVAVKILSKSKANGQDFINEVATIGRIHHINVVRLTGYCAERSKRALVYDFMPNGSLEKYAFSREGNMISLSWEKMYEISVGVARGIEYLHGGCDMQILHFDIKPHNILLDENFTPKVSDFGLAKLYPTDDSIVSLTAARGTMGYMAPELFYKNIGGVSYKADVYSFGMLLMEMTGKRRKNLNAPPDHSSQIYFPSWVYDEINEGNEIELGDVTEEERKMAKKMIVVALWCILMKPCDRPSMKQVVDILEGNVEQLQMPPKPFLYPQETPAEDHGIDTHHTELPILSSDSTESITLDSSA